MQTCWAWLALRQSNLAVHATSVLAAKLGSRDSIVRIPHSLFVDTIALIMQAVQEIVAKN